MTKIINCKNCKQDFILDEDDLTFYQKIEVSLPTFCPSCRQQRRMAWRNDYHFYPRTCASCGKKILSIYSSDKPFIIFCPTCWWSDKWNVLDYGRDINFNEPFFPQYMRLLKAVPTLAILNDNDIASVNCDYTNYFALGKNCCLVINSWKVENCMYSFCLVKAKDVVDCGILYSGGEQLYSCVYADNCFRSKYISNSSTLIRCSFCAECRGCSNCLMCVGLRNKSYCFKNQQYSKLEYEKIVDSYRLDSWSGVQQAAEEFKQFLMTYPHKYANLINCVNSSGEYLVNCKNARNCFIGVRVENSRYFERGDTIRDSYDCLSGGEQELCYESINPDNSSRTFFTSYCHKDNDVIYSDSCQSSSHLFGCVGLKKARYCILNKQYTKDEYEKLKAKLVEHMKRNEEWGEFFPATLSPFCYNESVAQDEFPLTKETAVTAGFSWQDSFATTTGKETLREIPDSINDIADSIINEILVCETCGRNYRILDWELKFYKANRVPIPRECFFCRFSKLYKIRGPIKLWHRKCQCAGEKSENGAYQNTIEHFHGKEPCLNEFETSYAPDRAEIVYCEKCYLQEVV